MNEEDGLGKLWNLNNGQMPLGESSHHCNFRRRDLPPRRPHTDTGRAIDWLTKKDYVTNFVSQSDKQ